MLNHLPLDNSAIYPSWSSIHKLAPNGWIKKVPLESTLTTGLAIRHILTSCAICYYVNQLPATSDNLQDRRELKTKILYHRDIVIRSLSETLADERMNTTDVTILTVLMFLLVDVSASVNWRENSHPFSFFFFLSMLEYTLTPTR